MATERFYVRDENELPEPITSYHGILWLLTIIIAITIGLILAHIG